MKLIYRRFMIRNKNLGTLYRYVIVVVRYTFMRLHKSKTLNANQF